MNIYILKAITDSNGVYVKPFETWYDKMFSCIVIAENENESREIANENGNDEIDCGYGDVWLNSEYTSCEILEIKKGIVIKDVRQA